MSFCKLIGLALMAQLLLGQVVAQERPEGQHRTEGGLVDLDWSFELKAGGKDDQVLDEDGVRGIVPDAVAGFMTPQGLFGTVVVEIEVLDDEAMLTTWLDGLPAGEKRIVERTRFQMGELEGAEVLVEGVVAGEMTVFLRRCILREGYCFQFTIWGPPAKGAEAALRAGAERFQFVDGKVRARWPATALRSDSGPGWRLRDNVYENTAYAIRVGQIPDWVPLTGLLVEAVNPNAYFGLRHERTGAVVLFMATVTTAETMPAMLTDVRQEVESMLGAPLEGGDRDVVISGQKRRFTSHRSPKTKGHRHEFAVWNDGNLCP
ncbi:MAG: hypothetical protein KDB53_13970, partial [Planctomycetes bacterium]|nr:hypothetical protein [Planctomycetota bacterium]